MKKVIRNVFNVLMTLLNFLQKMFDVKFKEMLWTKPDFKRQILEFFELSTSLLISKYQFFYSNLRISSLFLLLIWITQNCQLQIWSKQRQNNVVIYDPTLWYFPKNIFLILIVARNHPTSVSYIFISSLMKNDQ